MACSVTSTSSAYQPLSSGSATSAVVDGAVRSILMPSTVRSVGCRPCRSRTRWRTGCRPRPATVAVGRAVAVEPGERVDGRPARRSTSSLYQPAALGSVVGVAAQRRGGLVDVDVATPSRGLVAGRVGRPCRGRLVRALAEGLRRRAVVDARQRVVAGEVTVTSASYQPLALGARSGAAPIVGAVLSSETSAWSVGRVAGVVDGRAGDVLVAGPPSETTLSGRQLAMPESASVAGERDGHVDVVPAVRVGGRR